MPRIFRKEKLGEAEFDALPRFAFVEEPAGAVARRVLPALAWTLAPKVLLGWLGMKALCRYPVAG